MRSALVLTLLLGACGSDDDAGWRGPDTHVALHGTLGEVDFDLDLAEGITCKREYTGGVLGEVEVTIQIVDGGLEKQFELGLTAADFAALTPPVDLAVVDPGDDVVPASGEVRVEMQWEWEDPEAGFVTYEMAAGSGTLQLAELSGEPVDGVIPDATGAVGLSLDATWSDGSLAGSITAPCGANELES